MSQHTILCPNCGKCHDVDVLRNAGKPVAMVATEYCSYFTEDLDEIRVVLESEVRQVETSRNISRQLFATMAAQLSQANQSYEWINAYPSTWPKQLVTVKLKESQWAQFGM